MFEIMMSLPKPNCQVHSRGDSRSAIERGGRSFSGELVNVLKDRFQWRLCCANNKVRTGKSRCVAPLHKCLLFFLVGFDKLFRRVFDLIKNFFDWDVARYEVAVDSAANFFAVQIVHAQHRIAAVRFTESFRGFKIRQRVNEYWDEFLGALNYIFILQLTAGKSATARSSRVLAKM